jgi:hypothetical protein
MSIYSTRELRWTAIMKGNQVEIRKYEPLINPNAGY